jgi:hypothetical protein
LVLRLARLVVVDLSVGGIALALAGSSVLAALLMGAHPLWALGVFVLGLVRFVRETFFGSPRDEVQPHPVPSDALIDSPSKAAAAAVFRILPGLIAIIVVPAALVAWFWDPIGLIFGAAGLVLFGTEYLAAAVGVASWERAQDSLEFQSWVRAFRRERPALYTTPRRSLTSN